MSARVAWVAATVLTVAACAEAPSPALQAAVAAHPQAAQIWSGKCGACHVPVEPGTRRRAAIDAAMRAHRRRVPLSEPEWSGLVEFLATETPKAVR